MDEQLERYEEFEGASEGQPSLLSDGCDLSSKRAVEIWTGFLYGQPMWTLRSEDTIKEDFWALFAVYTFARTYVHWFAEDAALDAIRVMLTEHDSALGDLTSLLAGLYEHEKFKSLVNMLMDFTVHGPSAEEARLWAESDDVGEDKEVLKLKRALRFKFRMKADFERKGYDPTDLTLECLFHSHLFRGRPCYLNDGDGYRDWDKDEDGDEDGHGDGDGNGNGNGGWWGGRWWG